MPITFTQPDGLYLSAQASLAQLLTDDPLHAFADGLLHTALVTTCDLQPATGNLSLAQALHHPAAPEIYPLLTALLALDAEIQATVGEERRSLPLPAFLSYRPSLPPDKVPPEAVRLPPLNPGGRFAFAFSSNGDWLAVRLDLHQTLRVAGHVRLALSSPTRPPLRLRAIEEQLERRVMAGDLIEAAIAEGGKALTPPLNPMEGAAWVEALQRIVTTKDAA